ncbi:hypothetical protein CSC2_43370 [Clostridium zeae]|uniref:Transposon Tn7 transposition protein TnsD C-termianl domain-containing protein n=2 Tax=Clostridium zeae TaxID=2759022 RepID=A0ABQ1EG59_9CLOT|nr:hypothetical protein CSC2_43370 [Clostridium zeae]
MLHFFTDPYKDELIYSAIARYHYYVGNIDYKDTLEECFGKRSIIPSLEFGSPVKALAKNLGGNYTEKYILNKHTLLPFYKPFLLKSKLKEIIRELKYSDGSGVYTKIGMVAGSICKKEGIYYCPLCAKAELEAYGEAFIHREHQLQGIGLCPHHGITLYKYQRDRRISSRLEFIKLEEELIDLKSSSAPIEIYEIKYKLAKDAYWLINQELTAFDKRKLLDKYRNLLYSKGLTTSSGRIKQNQLYEEVINFYGKGLLINLECDIDNADEYNWLRVITRNLKRAVHPLRHLLLINFLVGDIAQFFSETTNTFNPFGEGPWPCLNKIAEHYHEAIITDLKITEDFKTRLPVGTFTCSCGFIYSRKGPDKSYEDRYKIGRIKVFGMVWEDKLKIFLKEGNYGLRELSRLMYCDPKTILKFDKKLGINCFNSSIEGGNADTISKLNEAKLETAKASILASINENPKSSRTEIRGLCKKEYTLIYRRDRLWLFDKLPKKKKKIEPNKLVSWEERDKEILKLVEAAYRELIELQPPVRITKSIIGKKLGKSADIDKRLDKLPSTQEYLKEKCETVEEFQLRRSKQIIKQLIEEELPVKLWEIQRLVGLRGKQFDNLRSMLEEYIFQLDNRGRNG